MQLHPLSFFQPRPAQPHLPLLIFFPGMDGTGRLLYKQVDRLAVKFDIYCLAIAGDDRTDWSRLVELSVKLIGSEIADTREMYLCGESFGACWAMQVAGKMKTEIDRLVLINPASSFARLPWLTEGSVLANLLPDMMYPLSARILVNVLIEPDRVAGSDRQNLVDAMLSVRPQTASWRLNLLRQFKVQSILPDLVDIPVLLIAGELDRLLPSLPEVRFLQQRLPKSKTIMLPHSGHACLLERDIQLADLL
jgi:pimeloyl-ACP methyl ester carboxylesterase